MMNDHQFREEYRFGSAAWASAEDVKRAGLFTPRGPQIGYFDGHPLHLDSDQPIITIAGAGAGKSTSVLAYVLCQLQVERLFVLDPRGELGAISIHNYAAKGINAYFWNPAGIAGLPQHRCNPLDILRADNPRFHADCRMIAESLVPFSGGGSSKYFEQRARDWIDALLKHIVTRQGVADFPSLYRLINIIEGDTQAWAAQLEAMLDSRFDSVRRTAGEMLSKQSDAPKEFGAIMGTIYAQLGFLDDPALLASLENPDLSLRDLCHPRQAASFFLNVPMEYISIWSPLLRCFFTSAMLYKSRAPDAPRLTMIIDEAGQMGNFEALLRAFTYGRGAGVRAWAVFQDVGQIARNFGAPAVQSFLGSAQCRQFFGVRDYETAELISKMIGMETLEYIDPLQRERAKHGKWQALFGTLMGHDPISAARDYKRFKAESEHRAKQTRRLITPEEILSLPEDRQILFISGLNLRPLLAEKYPYFTRPEMAGKYLPNPYHPPLDSVSVMTARGPERRRVITQTVPPELAHFVQYQDGLWRYIEGYRPALYEGYSHDG